MKSIKKIHSNIIDTFKTKYIWVAMLLCMALFFGANVYGEDSTDATGQIINLIKLKNINLLAKGEEFSREFVFCCFNENYWFEVLFPIIAGLATTSRFADEGLNGMYYFTTSRIGKKYYAIIEVISCFIISFFTIIICLGIFQIIIWEKLIQLNPFSDEIYKDYILYLDTILQDDILTKEENKKYIMLKNSKLDKKESIYHNMFLNDTSSILLVDGYYSLGKILYSSQNFPFIFNYNGKELLNATIDDLIPNVIQTFHKELIDNVIKYSNINFIFNNNTLQQLL